MKTRLGAGLIIISVLFFRQSFAQDTFSICAIDSVTGQVGSAGATCIASPTINAIIISDVHPDVGVVHTQAYWLAANQNYAKAMMNLGLTPQQIIDSVTLHDAGSNPAIRQYGVVTLAGGASAGWTGSNCDDYKNHILGPGYAIQGNILLGQQVLDSMQSRFLNTSGSLECRLMAALQGAKMVGADTRCTSYGISSFSAFIRVANPGDVAGSFYLDISVNTYPNHGDPIDSLQERFDLWGGCNAAYIPGYIREDGISIFPNPAQDQLTIVNREFAIKEVDVYNAIGQKQISVRASNIKQQSQIEIVVKNLTSGFYFIKVKGNNDEVICTRFFRN